VILKSITQFVYVHRRSHDVDFMMNSKPATNILELNRTTGDASLHLNRIKVKNSTEWQSQATSGTSSRAGTDTLVINTRVKVTYYRMHTFMDTFKDYLSHFEILHASLSPKFNRDMVFKAGMGAGRSGSFFFFSHDRKFIIKTMTESELKLFLRILPQIASHHQKVPNSLLAKIFGVFTVKMSHVDAVHIMLMENTLRLKEAKSLKYIFDLKGSLVDRKVKGATTTTTTLKDVNFLMAAERTPNFTTQTPLN